MSDTDSDSLLAGAIVAVGGIVTAAWLGAHTAAFAVGHDLEVRWPQAAPGLVRSLADPDDPARAWRATPGTFGPVWWYWTCTGVFVVGSLVAATGGWFWWTRVRVGIDRRERLGMVPEARMATRAELAPIRVKRPVPGRFTFGKVHGSLVATEDASTQSSRVRRNDRVGDRTSVMIFGPTRSGKTQTIKPGIIEWDLPAVLSSVKTDLMADTLDRRLDIGQVFLFDPFGVADSLVAEHPRGGEIVRVSWSPVACSTTISGAIAAAKTLADAATAGDLTNEGFWSDRGASLLWPLLFAASHSNHSMGTVVQWLALQDGVDKHSSQVLGILRGLVAGGGAVGVQASQALKVIEGWSDLDPKPRSEQNSTAQSLVSAWADPYASAASDPSVTPIDIGMILSGRNTLYIVQELGRGTQFSVLYGGLFGDLIRDQCYRIAANTPGGKVGPLLAVLDEAANTPLRWLPEVASTCVGLGVQLVTVWQDRNQIDALYEEYAQSILNNHATKLFFAGQTDEATLEYASKLCGEEEVTSNSASMDLNIGSRKRSASAQPVMKRLVPPDMLRQIPKWTALLVHDTLPPAHLIGRRMHREPPILPKGPLPSLELSPRALAALQQPYARLPARVVDHLSRTNRATSLGAMATEEPAQIEITAAMLQRIEDAPPPTPDDQTKLIDGRVIDSPEKLIAWLAEVDEIEAGTRPPLQNTRDS